MKAILDDNRHGCIAGRTGLYVDLGARQDRDSRFT
jgi:hypothetical protein